MKKTVSGGDYAAYLILITFWIAGIVMAKGFWSTLFAITLPPWAWYLVIEKVLMVIGWVSP